MKEILLAAIIGLAIALIAKDILLLVLKKDLSKWMLTMIILLIFITILFGSYWVLYPGTAQVPNLQNMSMEEAVKYAKDIGFVPEIEVEPKDITFKVFSHEPPQNTSLKKGSTIKIIVKKQEIEETIPKEPCEVEKTQKKNEREK